MVKKRERELKSFYKSVMIKISKIFEIPRCKLTNFI